MSAEDRALTALAYAIYRHKYPTGGGYGDDPAAWPIGGSVHEAKQLLEALSSEGLAVVPKADLRVVALTVRKLPTENVDLRNDIADHLRRLSGADQDG